MSARRTDSEVERRTLLPDYSIVAKRPLSETRRAIREEAIQTLKKWGDNPEVCRQVEALIGSLDDTLEEEFVLQEIRALKKSGMPFQEIFANVADR